MVHEKELDSAVQDLQVWLKTQRHLPQVIGKIIPVVISGGLVLNRWRIYKVKIRLFSWFTVTTFVEITRTRSIKSD